MGFEGNEGVIIVSLGEAPSVVREAFVSGPISLEGKNVCQGGGPVVKPPEENETEVKETDTVVAKRQKRGEQNIMRHLIVLKKCFGGGGVLFKRITINQLTEKSTDPTRQDKSEDVVACGALRHSVVRI